MRNGGIAICAVLSPYRDARDQLRREARRFVEVFVDCSMEKLQQRDPEGIYKRALAGELKQVPGVDVPYEPPGHADVTVHTDQVPVAEAATRVFQALVDLKYVGPTEFGRLTGGQRPRRGKPAKAGKPARGAARKKLQAKAAARKAPRKMAARTARPSKRRPLDPSGRRRAASGCAGSRSSPARSRARGAAVAAGSGIRYERRAMSPEEPRARSAPPPRRSSRARRTGSPRAAAPSSRSRRGVDSTLVLAVAREVLGDRAVALTAHSPSVPQAERAEARALAARLGVRHLERESHEQEDPGLRRERLRPLLPLQARAVPALRRGGARARGRRGPRRLQRRRPAGSPARPPRRGRGARPLAARRGGAHEARGPGLERGVRPADLGQAADGLPRLAHPVRHRR